MKQLIYGIFFGIVVVVITLSFFVGPSKKTADQNAIESTSNGDLSDPEKLTVCAGEFTFLALTFEKIPKYAGTEDTLLTKKQAFWFTNQSDKLIGAEKTFAYSTRTVKHLSERWRGENRKQLFFELINNTSECVQLVQRLLPETSRCFLVAPNKYTGFAMDFIC